MEEDRDENKYNSPPSSPSFDHGQPSFSLTETPTRRTSTCSIDTDNASLSRFRLPDFPGSRLVNMLLGSNKELSHSIDSVKDAPSNSFSAPFVLKSPVPRRRSCAEPSPLAMTEDRTSEQPLLPSFQEEKTSDEREGLLASEQIVFQDKPEYCAIKIPDLSVVEEESSGSSRGSSPVNDPADVTIPIDCSSSDDQSFEANTSFESLTSSSDSQSTSSFSGLLKNAV